MEYRLNFAEHARTEYRRILQHFPAIYSFPSTVRERTDEFFDAIDGVRAFPHRFPRARGVRWSELDVRYMVFKTYAVFFHIDDNKRIVTVLRILDYRQDLVDYFGGVDEQG